MIKHWIYVAICTISLVFNHAAHADPKIFFQTTHNQYGALQIIQKSTTFCTDSTLKNVPVSPLIVGCNTTTLGVQAYVFYTSTGQAYDLNIHTGQEFEQELDLTNTRNIYYFTPDHLGKTDPKQYVDIILPPDAEPFLQDITYTIAANKAELDAFLRKEVVSVSVGTPRPLFTKNDEDKLIPPTFYANPESLKEGDLGIRIVRMDSQDQRVILAITKIKRKRTYDAPSVAKDVALLTFQETNTEPTPASMLKTLPLNASYDIERSTPSGLSYQILTTHYENGIRISDIKTLLQQDLGLYSNEQGEDFSEHYATVWDFVYNPQRVVSLPSS